MNSYSIQQNNFHRNLNQYINQCGINRNDRMISLICPEFIFKKLAKTLSKEFIELESRLLKINSTPLKISIPEYKGNNVNVVNMISGLKIVENDIVCAFLHGSLATNEKINYSDFDATVILKSNVMRDPEKLAHVASKLNKLRQIMNQADPLQHHGWFVITELDLLHYCDAYFPTALFEFSRSLTETNGLTINVYPRDSQYETRAAFDALSNAVIYKTRNSTPPGNLFELKSLLSQFMLLPALYIQVQQTKGVFKKQSFELAKTDFTIESWEIMEKVSEIRLAWPAHEDRLQDTLLSMCPVLWHRWLTKLVSAQIPDELNKKLTKDFFNSMSNLVVLMQKNTNTQSQNA